MSKSLNIYIPAISGTALLLGVAYGWTARDYKSDQIAALEDRIEQVAAVATSATERASAEADRALALESEIAEMRVAAASGVGQRGGVSAPAPVHDNGLGLGRAALDEEVAAWDVDVLPDGRGLPEGSGDVFTGEEVFADKCASCHGDFAEGVGNWPVLAGGFDTLADKDPVKTVGSYWPYLSTVWDYVHRSMPFGEAGTLTADETYAIVAYILYSNDLVDDAFELSHENFADFEMYNKDGFVVDDRPELEYGQWRAEPCMENCKDSVEITMRATFLDVTPEDGGESVMNDASTTDTPTFTASTGDAEAESAPDGGLNAELVAAGEKVFRKCKACHAVGQGAENKTGPQLNGVMGRTMGSVEGFSYSSAFKAAHDEGRIWDDAAIMAFLAQPKSYIKGTKMAFSGLKKEADQQAIAEYLKSFAE